MSTRKLLSLWDQSAPKSYMSLALCFPLDTSKCSREDVLHHIQKAAKRLAAKRPDYAGRLIVDGRIPGAPKTSVFIETSPDDYIRVEELDVDFGTSYDELKRDGFPFRKFVNPGFTLALPFTPDSLPVPVSLLRVLFIDRGFVLFTHLHHSYADGKGVDTFLEQLADEARNIDGPLGPVETVSCDSFSELLEKCPKYKLREEATESSTPSSPQQLRAKEWGQMERVGKNFVMDITKNWIEPRKKLVVNEPSKVSYFGNAVVVVLAETPNIKTASDLVKACNWETSPMDVLEIAQAIMQSNRAVDEDFVFARTAMFAARPNHIHELDLFLDPRKPHHFSANTWAFIGHNAKFEFPGVDMTDNDGLPDAIRRVQAGWAMPHALIMPTWPEIGEDEV
ncbi:hypothetical protein QBC34DRAFT_464368 [Podospora aff. communis PSN243]|uniref:Trichothecene 3-O-acetyltransferase-like N-terminal domain-containing protein n=1 Tax=Podospora aff. communis PSN243 TaxID=3040156 RepID=A0AAV9GL76_9PEZI|nr:hypothetical protein QBC34DRAFT_464368 [Podospora aff. communis PSN243]